MQVDLSFFVMPMKKTEKTSSECYVFLYILKNRYMAEEQPFQPWKQSPERGKTEEGRNLITSLGSMTNVLPRILSGSYSFGF